MNYWQLVCNPAYWDIERKLKSDEEFDDWVISKSFKDKVKIGDQGIIRVTIDKRTKTKLNRLKRKKLESGYYALVEITDIFFGETKYPNYWINPTGIDKDLRIKIKINQKFLKKPLKTDSLKKINFDFDRVVLNPFQGKPVSPISKDSFIKLTELIENKSNLDQLTFGHIENIKVGQLFKDRDALSKSKIHGPTMAGIWGREAEGACSIVLSGGYSDDIDELDYIYYTGHGGQDKPGGRQISNQNFVKGNKALMLSCNYKLPVRVTRGFQIKNGPPKGYRYDGIYYVNEYERIKGKDGFYICRFHLTSEKPIEKLESEIIPNLKSNYERPGRALGTVNRIKRNIKLREYVVKMYEYKCQICNIFLDSPHGGIAEGAHIKGLGRPFNGLDILENIICLCPNHHKQLDRFSFYIDPLNYEIIGLNGYEGKKLNINKKHKIDKEALTFQKKQYYKNNKN